MFLGARGALGSRLTVIGYLWGLSSDSWARERLIFESLVLESVHDWNSSAFVRQLLDYERDEIRNGFRNGKSQRKLNCALSVEFLWKKKF